MDINNCKSCGKKPAMAEPMKYWFSIECCDQHVYDESPDHAVFLWNMQNNPINPNTEDKRVYANILAQIANDTNVSTNFKEMFAGA